MKPNALTVSSILPACAHLEALQDGQVIHDYVIKRGLESNPYVMSALIDMYVKCRHMDYAHQWFDEMSSRDVVSWSAMVSGYAQNGHGDEALKLFRAFCKFQTKLCFYHQRFISLCPFSCSATRQGDS